MAFVAIPVVQMHMGTARVVMPQDAVNQNESVGQAAFLQGFLNGEIGSVATLTNLSFQSICK